MPPPPPRLCTVLLLRPFTASNALLKKHKLPPLPPRPKSPPSSEFTESFLKGSGPGGQKINKTNSAVQLKHLPTGIVVKSQETRSREQNRKIARRILAERLDAIGYEGVHVPAQVARAKASGDGGVSEGGEMKRMTRAEAVAERKVKKKKSAEKKRRRKYRRLEEEKQVKGVGMTNDGEQGLIEDDIQEEVLEDDRVEGAEGAEKL